MNKAARSPLSRVLRDHRGATIGEYIILIGLVALGAVAAWKVFGKGLSGANDAQGATVVCVAEGAGGNCGGTSGNLGSLPPPPTGGTPPPATPTPAAPPPAPVAANDPAPCDCPPGSGNCFVAGTPVDTPSGEVAIEQLQAGDLVLSRDESTGVVSPKPIVRTYARLAPSLVDVRVVDVAGAEDVIRSTPEHRFWTLDRGWTEAGSLVGGEPLLDVDGRELALVSVTPLALEAPVFNFEVDETHTYFVGTSRVLVHNPTNYGGGDGTGPESSRGFPPTSSTDPYGSGSGTGPIRGGGGSGSNRAAPYPSSRPTPTASSDPTPTPTPMPAGPPGGAFSDTTETVGPTLPGGSGSCRLCKPGKPEGPHGTGTPEGLPQGPYIVYRNLRPDEDPTMGLNARNPENTDITPFTHVGKGTKLTRGTPYISTSKDPQVISHWNEGNRVCAIDTRYLQNDTQGNNNVYDVSTRPGGTAAGLKGPAVNFGMSSREVLLQGHVPPSAIRCN